MMTFKDMKIIDKMKPEQLDRVICDDIEEEYSQDQYDDYYWKPPR